MSPDQPWRRLMEEFNLEDDTLPIYAGRILEDIKLIRASVERGDATEAADVGVRLGQTLNECSMKSRFEKPALHGEKIRERVRANAAQNREKRKRNADAWHRRARAEAKCIREQHPDWPTTQVATLVKKRLKLSAAPRTVRDVISRK